MYAFEQGVPNKKHHCDTKSEPPYLAFTLTTFYKYDKIVKIFNPKFMIILQNSVYAYN